MISMKTLAMGAVLAAASLAMAQPANAAFTLVNDNLGDGFVTGAAPHFDLFGSDNGSGPNTTAYFDTSAVDQILHVDYVYSTVDCCGAFFDPGGYFLNLDQFQLSPTDPSSPPGVGSSGSFNFVLHAGDIYGFYIFTPDGVFGRGDIAVTLSPGVPEPASWALMIGGFGLAGVALRRRRAAAATA
jgi:hypothetical protein